MQRKGGGAMPRYIGLCRFTSKGLATIKEAPGRLDLARKLFEEHGARLVDFYLTLGEFDFVAISEAPDDETLATVILKAASQGTFTCETLKCLDEQQYRRIVSAL